jgi:hypothetical protein
MKKLLKKYRLLKIGVVLFAFFLILPDASAQMVRSRKVNRKFRKCSDIGKVKVKKTKMSRQMKQKLIDRYANINLSYRTINKKSSSKTTKNKNVSAQENINNNTASELSIANADIETGSETKPILLQENETVETKQVQAEVQQNTAILKKEDSIIEEKTVSVEEVITTEKNIVKIEEVLVEKKKTTGNVWYVSDEAIADEIKDLPFENDNDELSNSDIETLKKAAAQVRYGFSIELQEHFNQEDIDSGKNVSYKRANRLKSYLVHTLGVDSNAIYLNSFFDNRKTDPKRIQIVIKN